MYYVYMMRCEDNSIYTGITTDIKRRFTEHLSKTEKCAKYTQLHTVKKIESVWETENRVLASKLEYHIKRLNKDKKEKLISDNELLGKLIKKIDENEYKYVLK